MLELNKQPWYTHIYIYKSDETIGTFLLCYLWFHCSQLVSTLGHCQEKSFFTKFLKELICYNRSDNAMHWWHIHWMKIIFCYPRVFNWPLYICCWDTWQMNFSFGSFILSIVLVCFKIVVTLWVVYLGVYGSPQICPSIYKSVSFNLMFNPFGFSASRHFIHVCSCVSFKAVILSKTNGPDFWKNFSSTNLFLFFQIWLVWLSCMAYQSM